MIHHPALLHTPAPSAGMGQTDDVNNNKSGIDTSGKAEARVPTTTTTTATATVCTTVSSLVNNNTHKQFTHKRQQQHHTEHTGNNTYQCSVPPPFPFLWAYISKRPSRLSSFFVTLPPLQLVIAVVLLFNSPCRQSKPALSFLFSSSQVLTFSIFFFLCSAG